MVRTLKDAIILSQLREPKTSKEIADSIRLGKSSVTKSLTKMKKSGLVKGRGYYFLTNKGETQFDNTIRKISGERV